VLQRRARRTFTFRAALTTCCAPIATLTRTCCVPRGSTIAASASPPIAGEVDRLTP
jgi:hypothetical protein